MNVVFRVDASTLIGTGHVMRCLTLADALKAEGARCRFVCREHPGHLLALIRQHGFEAYGLPFRPNSTVPVEPTEMSREQYAYWLGESMDIDAHQTRIVVDDGSVVDWLVVDHYGLDVGWESSLRPFCKRVLVIDDLADRPHDCDLLLDQNLGRKEADYSGLVRQPCKILAGPRYALLRPEFAALREYSLKRRVHPQLQHILVTMGGVDKDNITSQVIDLIDKTKLSREIQISVVMGPHAPWLKTVQEKAESATHEIQVLSNVTNMAQLMADCDLVIGAAGSTSWERCCLGVPSIMVVLADNQRVLAKSLVESGSALFAGSAAELQEKLPKAFRLAADTHVLNAMSLSSRVVLDGAGAIRVVSELLDSSREQH